GVPPRGPLPASMVLSGLASAFIFAPSLLLVSDLVKRGHGEGLFGIFQIAGSLGFLAGPLVGGILRALTGVDGRPAYEAVFALVGLAELVLAAGAFALLRTLRAVAISLCSPPTLPRRRPTRSPRGG